MKKTTQEQIAKSIATFNATIDELMDISNRTDAEEFQLRMACDLRGQLLAQV